MGKLSSALREFSPLGSASELLLSLFLLTLPLQLCEALYNNHLDILLVKVLQSTVVVVFW